MHGVYLCIDPPHLNIVLFFQQYARQFLIGREYRRDSGAVESSFEVRPIYVQLGRNLDCMVASPIDNDVMVRQKVTANSGYMGTGIIML